MKKRYHGRIDPGEQGVRADTVAVGSNADFRRVYIVLFDEEGAVISNAALTTDQARSLVANINEAILMAEGMPEPTLRRFGAIGVH